MDRRTRKTPRQNSGANKTELHSSVAEQETAPWASSALKENIADLMKGLKTFDGKTAEKFREWSERATVVLSVSQRNIYEELLKGLTKEVEPWPIVQPMGLVIGATKSPRRAAIEFKQAKVNQSPAAEPQRACFAPLVESPKTARSLTPSTGAGDEGKFITVAVAAGLYDEMPRLGAGVVGPGI